MFYWSLDYVIWIFFEFVYIVSEDNIIIFEQFLLILSLSLRIINDRLINLFYFHFHIIRLEFDFIPLIREVIILIQVVVIFERNFNFGPRFTSLLAYFCLDVALVAEFFFESYKRLIYVFPFLIFFDFFGLFGVFVIFLDLGPIGHDIPDPDWLWLIRKVHFDGMGAQLQHDYIVPLLQQFLDVLRAFL
jgi:hypothetical protein